jgi:hypothetical protein
MTYVITYGPLGVETEVSCETATEALAALTELSRDSAPNLTVSSFQTEAEARKSLRVLAEMENEAGG